MFSRLYLFCLLPLFFCASAATAKQEIEKYANGKTESITTYDSKGNRHGVTKFYFKNGQLQEESYYHMGKLHGVKKQWNEDGKQRYEGSYKNGDRDGLEKKWDYDGDLSSEAMYKAGDYHGKVKRYYDGKLDEVSIYKYGKRHGKETEYHKNGKVESITYYKNGKQHGKVADYYDTGKMERIAIYKAGKKMGIEKRFYKNGKLKSLISWNGYRKNGEYKTYNENGKPDELGKYKEGEKDGKYFEYNYKGVLERITTYAEGTKEGKYVEYFTEKNKSKKKIIRYYKDNKVDGKYREYYANGKKLFRGQYKEDKKVGVWKFYLDTGKLRTIEPYNSDGRLHGEKKIFHLNGKLMELSIYEDGNYKSGKKYYKNGKEISDKPGTLITAKTKTAKYGKNFFAIEDEIEVMMVRVGPKERNELLVKIIGVDDDMDGKVFVVRSESSNHRSKCLKAWNPKTKSTWCIFRTTDVIWSIKKMDMFLSSEKISFLKSAMFKKTERKKTKFKPEQMLKEYLESEAKS